MNPLTILIYLLYLQVALSQPTPTPTPTPFITPSTPMYNVPLNPAGPGQPYIQRIKDAQCHG